MVLYEPALNLLTFSTFSHWGTNSLKPVRLWEAGRPLVCPKFTSSKLSSMFGIQGTVAYPPSLQSPPSSISQDNGKVLFWSGCPYNMRPPLLQVLWRDRPGQKHLAHLFRQDSQYTSTCRRPSAAAGCLAPALCEHSPWPFPVL